MRVEKRVDIKEESDRVRELLEGYLTSLLLVNGIRSLYKEIGLW